MIEKSLVFRNVHVPGETHTYTVRVEVCIEFLNEDEDDDDCHLDFVSSIWDIKEIRLTDYTKEVDEQAASSWGVGFYVSNGPELEKIKTLVQSFDFLEFVYDRIANGFEPIANYGDHWL